MMYYVYAHHYQGEVFYVGCGTIARALEMHSRNSDWHTAVRWYGTYAVHLLSGHEGRADALAEERRVIALLCPVANVHFNAGLRRKVREQHRREAAEWKREACGWYWWARRILWHPQSRVQRHRRVFLACA